MSISEANQFDDRLDGLPATALKLALLAARIGVWHWDLQTDTISYSELARSISGFPKTGNITSAMLQALTHSDDYDRVSEIARRAFDPVTRGSEVYSYRIIRPDNGDTRYVEAHGLAKFEKIDGVEVAVSYTGSIQDVTERHLMQNAIADQEARLRLAIEAGELGVWDVDIVSGAISTSPELNRLFGFPADKTPSAEEFRSLYAPGEEERLAAVSAEQLASGGNKVQTAVRYILGDAQEKTFLLRAHMQPDTPPFTRAIGVLIDVTDRVRQEQRVSTIAMEMRHRLTNAFAVISSIASRCWPRDDQNEGLRWFQGRLGAISSATDLMFQTDTQNILIADLAERIVAPYRSPDRDHFMFDGPEVTVPHALATPISMALHELATNAVKYGALSTAEGHVAIHWEKSEDGGLCISWQEEGGPAVFPPSHTGFGSTLIGNILFPSPHRVEHEFNAAGVRCTITLQPA